MHSRKFASQLWNASAEIRSKSFRRTWSVVYLNVLDRLWMINIIQFPVLNSYFQRRQMAYSWVDKTKWISRLGDKLNFLYKRNWASVEGTDKTEWLLLHERHTLSTGNKHNLSIVLLTIGNVYLLIFKWKSVNIFFIVGHRVYDQENVRSVAPE